MEEEFIVNVDVDDHGSAEETAAALQKLHKNMILIKEEQAKLKKEYEAGKITLDDYISKSVKLDAAYKKQTQSTKDLTEASKKNKEEFKKTAETIADKVVPGLAGATTGMYNFITACWKFIATPIGAIIASIGAVLAILIGYFKGSAEGQERWNRIVNIGMALWGQLKKVLQEVGNWIYEHGIKYVEMFANAYQFLADKLGINTKALSDYVDALEKAAGKISDLQERIKLWERILILQREQVKASIAEMKLALEDKNIPLQQRIELARKVQQAIEKQGSTERELARMRLEEHTRIMMQGTATEEQLVKQAELEANLFKIDKEIADQKKDVFTKEMGFIKELRDAQIKASEDARLARIAGLDKELEEKHKQWEKENEIRQKFLEQQLAANKRFGDRMSKDLDARLKKEQKQKEEDAKKQLEIENLKNEGIAGGIEIIAEKKKEARIALNFLFKQDAMKEIITNTETGAIAAYKAMAGIPIVGPALGAVAAGLITAYGVARLGSVLGISFFGRGGKVGEKEGTFGGRSHSEGGTKYYGEDGRVIEVEKDENFYVLNKRASQKINNLSSLNVAEGGRSFSVKTSHAAMGGMIETSSASNQGVSSQELLSATVEAISKMNVFVKVGDISKGLEDQNRVQKQAKVVGR